MTINHPCGASIHVQVFWTNAGWTSVTPDLRAVTIESDRRTPLTNLFEPGRLVMQLDNRDRKYDPSYGPGPLYGNLKPGRLVRAIINGTDSWWGFVDRFSFDYHQSMRDATVTITCVTALAFAAQQVVPAGVTPVLTEGEKVVYRAGAIVAVGAAGTNSSAPGWASADADYTARCSGPDRWDGSRDRNVRDELSKLAALELGPIFSSQTGNEVLIHPRHWFATSPVSAGLTAWFGAGTYGPGTPRFPIYDASIRFDADELITAVSMTDELGNAVVSIDTAGEAEYGTRYPASSYSELPSLNDEDLAGAANATLRLRATETFRIESLTVKPAALPALAAALDELVLLSRVNATWSVPGGGEVSGAYFIDGITHQITPGDWTTSYSLWPCAPFDAAIPGTLFTVGSSLVGGAHVVGL